MAKSIKTRKLKGLAGLAAIMVNSLKEHSKMESLQAMEELYMIHKAKEVIIIWVKLKISKEMD